MVSIVSSENDKDKIKSYPKKKITEKKEEKTLTAASSSDSSSIPSSSSAVIELKSENKSECPIIDTKNSIKFSQPITPQICKIYINMYIFYYYSIFFVLFLIFL